MIEVIVLGVVAITVIICVFLTSSDVITGHGKSKKPTLEEVVRTPAPVVEGISGYHLRAHGQHQYEQGYREGYDHGLQRAQRDTVGNRGKMTMVVERRQW